MDLQCILFIGCLCILLVESAPGQGTVSPAMMKTLESIQKSLRKLETLPAGIDRALAQEQIADQYSQVGALEASAEYFEAAAETLEEIGRPGKEPFYNAGMTYLNLRKYDKAEKALQNAVRIEPLFRHAHVKLASLYRDTGDHLNVQKHLSIAIKLAPRSPDAYMYLADTYNNLKQFELAIEQYKSALALSGHPDAIATICCNMGDTYVNLRQNVCISSLLYRCPFH